MPNPKTITKVRATDKINRPLKDHLQRITGVMEQPDHQTPHPKEGEDTAPARATRPTRPAHPTPPVRETGATVEAEEAAHRTRHHHLQQARGNSRTCSK